jgi:hypothetical protein
VAKKWGKSKVRAGRRLTGIDSSQAGGGFYLGKSTALVVAMSENSGERPKKRVDFQYVFSFNGY